MAGGVIAYLFGRSRRAAFIAGVTGVLIADVVASIEVWSRGIDQTLALGGAGAYDAVVISGILAAVSSTHLLRWPRPAGRFPPQRR